MTSPALRVDLERARAHWFRRAGLAAPAKGALPEVIGATGWPRTLGGADVYLSTRARAPGLRRADLDAAVGSLALRVVPAVRGCMYLVPADDVPLVLRIAAESWRPRMTRELERAGSSWREVEELSAAVQGALGGRSLSTDAIRREVPVRSLGERGKKLGLSSPLPVALRLLELDDAITRVPETGRLDTERYLWRCSAPGAKVVRVPDDPVDRWAHLARVFFGHAGPARLADFAAWAGLAQRDAKLAIARVDLVPVAVDGVGDALLLADQRTALVEAAAGDAIAALSFEDNYLVCHGGPAPLADVTHHGLEVGSWGSAKLTTLGEAAHLASRPVVHGGRIVAFWELASTERPETVLAPLSPLSPPLRKRVEAHLADTAAFLLGELGHGRSFSLDTDATVAERAATLAKLGSGRPAKKPAAKKPAAKTPKTKKAAAKKPAAQSGRKPRR